MTVTPLKIRLFGQFEIRMGGSCLDNLGTRKSTGLFAHLILHRGNSIRREYLAELFWPGLNETAGRKALRTSLWRIRRCLKAIDVDPASLLNVSRHDIAFRRDVACDVDVSVFEADVAPYLTRSATHLTSDDATILQSCLRRYRGNLLENDLSDWCALERQELRALYIHVLELLMGYCENKEQWDGAIAYGHKLVSLDSLLEHVQFALMRCYLAKADRSSAIRCYQNLRRVLCDELGISPAREVTAFYDRLLRDKGTLPDPTLRQTHERSTRLADDANRALRSVNQAAALLDRISRSL